MTLDDLIDYVMTESGEFIVGDLETTQIDRHRFHLIVKRALAIYGKYRPLTERRTVLVRERIDLSNGGADKAPEWLSRVMPLYSDGGEGVNDIATGMSAAQLVYGSIGMGGYTNLYNTSDFGISSQYNTTAPRNIPWEYNKPILSVLNADGMFDITAHFNYELTDVVRDDKKRVTKATVSGVDFGDDLFMELLVGYFLIALGRSRRAFTLNDLPVTMDGGELVGEGEEKVRNAREQLQEQSSWSLALGE